MVSRHDFKQLADIIEQLADIIEQLSDNRVLCKQMGIAGRMRYEELFTLPVFEKRITECLKNLL